MTGAIPPLLQNAFNVNRGTALYFNLTFSKSTEMKEI
jgi:hypothetical protein